MMIIKYLFSLFLTYHLVKGDDVIVTIPNGQLRGRLEYSLRKNVTFYAFQQIPFGKPPVGELRFREPQPAEPWSGILDANQNTKACYQVNDFLNISSIQTEDCLFLNVYTPKYPSTTNSYPVLFFLYGGGFMGGASTFTAAGPHYLIEGEVIVVTASYRVGPFGFLSTGDAASPGNYGLKDQTLALKWVRDNIKYFGGDPDKVTIHGASAGGASVTFHLASPQSRGLFRAGISHSGSLLMPWAYQDGAKEIAYRLAQAIDGNFDPTATTEELVQFLRSATADQVNMAAKTFQESIGNEQIVQGFFFGPVIEQPSETAFITEPMYSTIEGGRMSKVPLFIGINSEEALDRITYSYFPGSVQAYDADVKQLVNRNMHIQDDATKETIGNEIRRIYTDGRLQDNMAAAIKYFSDMSFTRPLIRHAHMQSIYSDVYFYQFSYHGQLGGNRPYLEGADRVAHSEEGNYVWCYGNWSYLEYWPPADVLTSERFRTLMTNFVKYLNPTPKRSKLLDNIIWPTVKNYDFKYLNINDTLSIETDPKNLTYPQWVHLYDDDSYRPFITY
uniref:Carboxylic ester hydrolase n=2 Tax=Diabrotica virgifera virgifera TaxID=50390 RepID=A0A6P7F0V5_DIAVI